jgi:prevent-host-death family protein
MKQFSLSDLQRSQGEVVDAAIAAPVELTKHGKARLVVMSKEHYDRLTQQPEDPRRAFYWNELPDDIAESLSDAMEDWLSKNGGSDGA